MAALIKTYSTIVLFISLLFSGLAYGELLPEEEHAAFNPGEMITHHILDAHDWHFATVNDHDYSIPLPVIILSSDRGVEVFSSSKFNHGHSSYKGYSLERNHIITAENGRRVFDLSITKNVASLFISAILLLSIFGIIGSSYGNRKGMAPKGIQSFFEPIIVYVRDDIAKKIIGPKYERFLPYLLTVFFFIWFNNLLGLMPGGANLTGNIAVTLVLALLTFIITHLHANKYYWRHILNPPGLPAAIKILIVPIEIVGMFTKPFSLMVRLFANITAGHIIILSLLGLIFIFKHVGASLISIPFVLFMSALELFVALLQAFIFTLLTAMYFGSAVEEHAHPDHDHGH